MRALVLALLLLGISCSPSPAAAPVAQPEPKAPSESAEARPKRERTPGRVIPHTYADYLERPSRLEKEKPDEVVRLMGLKDGDVVADVGAATGFYTRRAARAVAPSGKVYANDIQPELLERLEELAAEEGITNIIPVLGTETDPKLPAGQMDWILIVDSYHEFQEPEAMLQKIRKSLKPNGRVALIEQRLEGDTASDHSPEHRMSVEQVLSEWEPAGFTLIKIIETLPKQHMFLFSVRRGARAVP